MSDACIVACGAVSALGRGQSATTMAGVGQPARTEVARDAELAAAGFRRPNAARAPQQLGVEGSDDRAVELLTCALQQLCEELDRQLPDWRGLRVGVALGTSSGGMLTAERLFRRRAADGTVEPALARGATYFAPFCDALRTVGIQVGDGMGYDGLAVPSDVRSADSSTVVPVRFTQVLAACASSTLAIGLGLRWLAAGCCDLVVAGGYDGLSQFVAAGFEAIRATTASQPAPFRVARDGMALAEGACTLALTRPQDAGSAPPLGYVVGFGASGDAVHITAPDREGRGLARAASAALEEAGMRGDQIDLVSAHGTATPYNDAMEARAITEVCRGSRPPIVHPYKAEIGHTLGAPGALELLTAVRCLQTQVAPAAWGQGAVEPDAWLELLPRSAHRRLDGALKLSAAFGGVTAALVLTRTTRGRPTPPARPVYVHGSTTVSDVDRAQLAEATGVARNRLARMDDISQLAVAAVSELAVKVGRAELSGAGIVQGHGLATLDVNERFYQRLSQRGPRYVDPRLFPGTSPNAAAGHCAIVHGLTGPSFAVGAGLAGSLEALWAAAELVAAGDAERMVVLAADDAGEVAQDWLRALGLEGRLLRRGAVALLLSCHAAVQGHGGRPLPPAADRFGLPELRAAHERGPVGHLALVEWLGRLPSPSST